MSDTDTDNNTIQNTQQYLLLNCSNGGRLVKYLTNFNNYLFYDDYVTLKKNKNIKNQIIDAFMKKMAEQALGNLAGKAGISQLGSLSKGKKGLLGSIGKIGSLKKKGGAGLSSLKSISGKIPSKSKSGNKLSKLGKKTSKSGKKTSKSISTSMCETISSQFAPDKVKTKPFQTFINQFINIFKNLYKEQGLEIFNFAVILASRPDFVQKKGTEIAIRSMCADPKTSFQAIVLRNPRAIALLAITGIEETIKDIDNILQETYKSRYTEYTNGIIDLHNQSNKKCLKVKIISSTPLPSVCIKSINREIKKITLKNGQIFDSNKLAIVKNKDFKTITIDNIEQHLIKDPTMSDTIDIRKTCNIKLED